MSFTIPPEVVGMKLFRVTKADELIACESVRFVNGAGAVCTALMRARIRGHVEIGGDIKDHFADLLNDDEDIVETVALDRNSYRELKVRQCRCKVEKL